MQKAKETEFLKGVFLLFRDVVFICLHAVTPFDGTHFVTRSYASTYASLVEHAAEASYDPPARARRKTRILAHSLVPAQKEVDGLA